VVHFVFPDSASAEIPLVLQGKTPEQIASKIGSGKVSAGARAVVLGGAVDPEGFDKMRSAVKSTAGAGTVPWLRQDSSKPAPPLGPEYGKAMVERVREALASLEAAGKLDGSSDEVTWY
jgi:hypothetical protein